VTRSALLSVEMHDQHETCVENIQSLYTLSYALGHRTNESLIHTSVNAYRIYWATERTTDVDG